MGNRRLTEAATALCSAPMACRPLHWEIDPTGGPVDDPADRVLGLVPRNGWLLRWRPDSDAFRDPTGASIVAEPPGVEEARSPMGGSTNE